jgi:restriction system protein
MARRSKKNLIEPKALFSLFVVLAAIWIAAQLFQRMPDAAGNIVGLIVLGLVVAVITYPVIRFLHHARVRQSLLRKSRSMSDDQLTALLRRRAQLVRLDPYGKPRSEQWTKEIDYFISQHIQPVLTRSESASLRRNYDKVVNIIETRVHNGLSEQPPFQDFSDDITPAEFETFCAEQLRQAGWNARVTLQSRDQGVDVIAEKNGRRVVLQCKLYGRPVGNKSVQEATAARGHEQADFGIAPEPQLGRATISASRFFRSR